MNLSPEVLTLIVALVTLVIAGVILYRSGKPLTMETVTSTLTEASGQAVELTETALTAARAAEQLWRSGKITRDERFTHAFDYVQRWFPDLDEDVVVTAIEAAVPLVNRLFADRPKPPPDEVGNFKPTPDSTSLRINLPR